jgi:hypothetical protein
MRKRCTLLLAVLTVSACDIGGAATPGVSVSDSAGVQIVSSEAATWATGEQWRLGDRPRIEIGVIEGDLVYQFDRIMGAITLSNGQVAVADMGSSEVRLFDRTGQHLMSVGGTGDGPGEFRQITGLYPLNGEGFAVENRRHRIQTFGRDGALRGSVPVGDFSRDIDPVTFHLNPPASVHVVGWLEDGSFVGWRSEVTPGT